ncbi:MAG: selenium-binding family protein [Gemmatimonadota bacterium]|nr:selenium-binding family protein [Gemmatimonadota bacterium]
MQRLRAVLCFLSALPAACTAHHATDAASPAVVATSPTAAAEAPARYLYVWAGDKDEKDSDFMAVVDIRPTSSTYGQVVATEPVGMGGTLPHHTEYELPGPGRLLFANGHHHEKIFLFDTDSASRPRLVRTLPPVPPYRYPHDFLRLPNGNLLIGFLRSEGPSPTPGDTLVPGGHGGMAEVDGQGRVIRTASAAVAGLGAPVRVYAFAPRPDVDRLLTTSAPMMEDTTAHVVQVWRLSDLTLLHTLAVPPARLPDGTLIPRGHQLPFEPRVMPDGSVLLNAYGCGFYRVTGMDTAEPRITNVHTIDVRAVGDSLGACGVPVVVGRFWVMSVGRLSALVTLNVSDPARPVEVSRLQADAGFRPHWLARDPGSDRLIVGAENGGENRMLMAHLDASTGRIRWDESLRADDGKLGISFRRERWPHGATGEAFGHAALFRP